jgi:transposase
MRLNVTQELVEALGVRALPYRTVARWIEAFQRGREASADLQRSGRPLCVRTDVSRAVIAQCMEEDRRWSLKELYIRTRKS